MNKFIAGILVTFALIAVSFSAPNDAMAKGNPNEGVKVCPDSNGWVKVESSVFTPVTGTNEYCFKAGPYLTYATELPEGGFGQEGACNEANKQNCGLSHWSYRTTSTTFPQCTDLLREPGDKASHATGWHQIVGMQGQVWGSDDVYSLANGNYAQCYCDTQGSGIQTNWWRTTLESLTGWFSENGLQWNLGNYHYLAQNSEFQCAQ
jgi:hypothetical protein